MVSPLEPNRSNPHIQETTNFNRIFSFEESTRGYISVWDKMEAFYHVAKAGSFTKAAKTLHKTQNALSVAVGTLEGRLGHRLLHRRVNGVELTRKGEEVFQTAQHILSELSIMKTTLNDTKGMKGTIRISTTHAVMDYILADHLVDFKIQHPEIVFDVVGGNSMEDIIYNEVDISIRPYDPDERGFVQKHLLTTKSGLYASQAYIDRYGEPRTVEELDSHKFITRSRPQSNPYSDVDWPLKVGKKDRRLRKPVFVGNSSETLFKAAEKGIGIITSHTGMDAIQRYNLKKILPDLKSNEIEHYLIYPKRLEKIERIVEFEKFLINRFKSMR